MAWGEFTFWYWFLFAVVFLLLELLSGSGFLLWAAMSALVVGVYAGLVIESTWQLQTYLFCGLSLISVMLWWFYCKRRHQHVTPHHLNERAAQYVGQIFKVIETIEYERGKIDIYGVPWVVQATEDLAVDTAVKVIGVNGSVLLVERAKIDE